MPVRISYFPFTQLVLVALVRLSVCVRPAEQGDDRGHPPLTLLRVLGRGQSVSLMEKPFEGCRQFLEHSTHGAVDVCEEHEGYVHRAFGQGKCPRRILHEMLNEVHENPKADVNKLIAKHYPITPQLFSPWANSFTPFVLAPRGEGDWSTLHERGVFLLKNFLSPEEADRTVQMTKSQSPMTSEQTYANSALCNFRHSKMYNIRADSPLMPSLLQERMSKAVGLESSTEEPTSLTGYSKGDFYSAHFDENPCDHHENGGEVAGIAGVSSAVTWSSRVCERKRRLGTLLVYLTDAIEGGGGATYFPLLNLRVLPEKGSAIFFRPSTPSGETDPAMLHTAETVTKGNKVVMQQWFDGM